MAILVVAGGILGFGYSEAVQGHSFIAPSALGVGLLVAVIFGQLTQNGFGKWILDQGQLRYFSFGWAISAIILIGFALDIQDIYTLHWMVVPLAFLFTIERMSLEKTEEDIDRLLLLTSFLIFSWIFIELIFEERIAKSTSFLLAALSCGIGHLLSQRETLDRRAVGGGLILAGMMTLLHDGWRIPWPYTGDGTIVMGGIAIGIALLINTKVKKSEWSEEIPPWIWVIPVLIFLWFYWDGIWEDIVSRHHEFYHFGMFNSMASNGAEDITHLCDGVPNHPLSEGWSWGEPNSCWLYATGGFSLPVLALIPFHLLSLESFATYRLLGLTFFGIALFGFHRLLKKEMGERSALIGVCLVALAPTHIYWAQMFTFNHFLFIWMVFAVGAWLPVFMDDDLEEISTKKWIQLHALSAVGPLVGLPTGSAVLATMSLIIIVGNRSQIKTKAIHAGLLLLWPILTFLIFSAWIDYWFPLLGAEYLQDKAESRSQFTTYLTDIEYYTRQLDWHTRISGAGILGIGVMGLIHLIRHFRETKHRNIIIIAIIFLSPSILKWTIFTQSSHIHDYWVNSYIFALAIGGVIAFRNSQNNRLSLVAVCVILLTTSIGVDDLNRRQKDDFSFSMQEFLIDNVDENDIVIVDNTIWSSNTYMFLLPDDTIHIAATNNAAKFDQSFNHSAPDYIIHTSLAWDGWDVEDHLIDSGYCNENVSSRWNLPPYTVWSPC